MMRSFFTCLALAAFALCIVGFAAQADAATCGVKCSDCKSTTKTKVYTGGGPVPICPIGYDIVEVTWSANCADGPAGPTTLLRCGFNDDGFTYSANGRTHEIVVRTNWQDVLGGACVSVVGYTVDNKCRI